MLKPSSGLVKSSADMFRKTIHQPKPMFVARLRINCYYYKLKEKQVTNIGYNVYPSITVSYDSDVFVITVF